ncbi:MAG: T9SS type A sorting domain-containing protein [bacterium]|nr:T9SS type A sorting domain-containing protein [bacterium]
MRFKLLCTALLAASWLSTTAFAATHNVSISNFAFAPTSQTIQPGDSVRWTNNDTSPHTVTATDGSFDSDFLAVGASFSHLFAQAGTFAYVCQYHSNMTAVINVGTSGGGDTTTWSELTSPTSLPLNDVRFLDANTGWIAGNQGVLRTTNGGDSWQLVGTPEDLEAVFFISATEGWVCGNDGYIAHSTNGGQSWTPQTSGAPDKLRDIWFTDSQNGWACGKDGILIHTTNGGAIWSPQSSPAQDDLRGIHMLDSQRGWMVGSDGLIMYTSNGGNAWNTQLSVPGGEEDEFEAVMAMDENTAWAAGGQGRIYHTSNGGQTWTPQTSSTTVALMDIFFTNQDNGWVCGAGGFLASAMDNGDMWSTQEPPVVSSFNAIYFVNDTLGFLVTGDGRIFRYEAGEIISSTPQEHQHGVTAFELKDNYPNPFNPATTIEFSLNTSGYTTLTVFDILGQQIAQPVNGNLSSGAHRVEFSATELPSGAYFYQLASGGHVDTRKMVLLK